MSHDAIKYKKENPNIDYQKMNRNELSKLPKYTGVIDFKISQTSFKMLNILNDDSSVVKFFWYGSHDIQSLDLWYEISKEEGIYIDVGAHTGLYSLTSVKANKMNFVISIEPYFMNMARLITNLRLNNISNKNIEMLIVAASNENTVKNFHIPNKSILSKGGKINENGEPVKVIKLDNLKIDKTNKPIKGIKIDTEGEDLNVLMGSQEIINKFKPKIIIEVRESNKTDIIDFFKTINYSVYKVSNPSIKIASYDLNIDKVENILAAPNET